MDPASCLAVAQSFLEKRSCSGSVVFCMVGGSRAYNLATEASDIDYVGVYCVDTTTLLRSTSSALIPSAPLSTRPGDAGPDITMYEAKQFLVQVCKGNPFCMEMLFAQHLCWMSDEWKALRTFRSDVLSCEAVREYVSYVHNRLAEHKVKPKVGKRIYHVVRLLNDAERMVDGLDPLIFLPEGPLRHYLMSIRAQQDPSSCNIEQACADLTRSIEAKLQISTLQGSARRDRINNWLVQMRLSNWNDRG